MEKERVRKFKNRQKRLAKSISKAIGLELDSIEYEEYLPGVRTDWNTGKFILKEISQICIPCARVRPSFKQRIHVIITFKGVIKNTDLKKINFILKTRYEKLGYSAIMYSINPHNNSSI